MYNSRYIYRIMACEVLHKDISTCIIIESKGSREGTGFATTHSHHVRSGGLTKALCIGFHIKKRLSA